MANTPAVNVSFPLGPVPTWQLWTVENSSTNFLITAPDSSTSTVAKAAATSQSVSLLTPAVNFRVLNAAMKSTTAFVGPATLTATVGITGSLTGVISVAYDLKAAVGVTNFSVPTLVSAASSFNGTDAIILALTTTVNNVSTISAGKVSVWLEIVYLP